MNEEPDLSSKLRIKLIGLPEGAGKVHHCWPDAYCVARSGWHAAFATPPIETLPYNLDASHKGKRFDFIDNDSVDKMEVEVGRWYSLVYCEFPRRGSWTVVIPHQPSLHFQALKARRSKHKTVRRA